MLLDADNIDINLQSNSGYSPLHLAAYEGHLEVTRMLLDDDNIDINLQSNSGSTAYDLAVYWDKDETAKVIKTKATALGSSDYCNKKCWMVSSVNDDNMETDQI